MGSSVLAELVALIRDHPYVSCSSLVFLTPPFWPILKYFSPLLISTALFLVALVTMGPQFEDPSEQERELQSSPEFNAEDEMGFKAEDVTRDVKRKKSSKDIRSSLSDWVSSCKESGLMWAEQKLRNENFRAVSLNDENVSILQEAFSHSVEEKPRLMVKLVTRRIPAEEESVAQERHLQRQGVPELSNSGSWNSFHGSSGRSFETPPSFTAATNTRDLPHDFFAHHPGLSRRLDSDPSLFDNVEPPPIEHDMPPQITGPASVIAPLFKYIEDASDSDEYDHHHSDHDEDMHLEFGEPSLDAESVSQDELSLVNGTYGQLPPFTVQEEDLPSSSGSDEGRHYFAESRPGNEEVETSLPSRHSEVHGRGSDEGRHYFAESRPGNEEVETSLPSRHSEVHGRGSDEGRHYFAESRPGNEEVETSLPSRHSEVHGRGSDEGRHYFAESRPGNEEVETSLPSRHSEVHGRGSDEGRHYFAESRPGNEEVETSLPSRHSEVHGRGSDEGRHYFAESRPGNEEVETSLPSRHSEVHGRGSDEGRHYFAESRPGNEEVETSLPSRHSEVHGRGSDEGRHYFAESRPGNEEVETSLPSRHSEVHGRGSDEGRHYFAESRPGNEEVETSLPSRHSEVHGRGSDERRHYFAESRPGNEEMETSLPSRHSEVHGRGSDEGRHYFAESRPGNEEVETSLPSRHSEVHGRGSDERRHYFAESRPGNEEMETSLPSRHSEVHGRGSDEGRHYFAESRPGNEEVETSLPSRHSEVHGRGIDLHDQQAVDAVGTHESIASHANDVSKQHALSAEILHEERSVPALVIHDESHPSATPTHDESPQVNDDTELHDMPELEDVLPVANEVHVAPAAVEKSSGLLPGDLHPGVILGDAPVGHQEPDVLGLPADQATDSETFYKDAEVHSAARVDVPVEPHHFVERSISLPVAGSLATAESFESATGHEDLAHLDRPLPDVQEPAHQPRTLGNAISLPAGSHPIHPLIIPPKTVDQGPLSPDTDLGYATTPERRGVVGRFFAAERYNSITSMSGDESEFALPTRVLSHKEKLSNLEYLSNSMPSPSSGESSSRRSADISLLRATTYEQVIHVSDKLRGFIEDSPSKKFQADAPQLQITPPSKKVSLNIPPSKSAILASALGRPSIRPVVSSTRTSAMNYSSSEESSGDEQIQLDSDSEGDDSSESDSDFETLPARTRLKMPGKLLVRIHTPQPVVHGKKTDVESVKK